MPADKQILFGLCTTPGANWREKVEEIGQLGLTQIALLPTALKPDERKVLYAALAECAGLAIPYVHLRDDFTVAEIDYLVEHFKTKFFSCHADEKGYAFLDKTPKYNSVIFVENFANEKRDKMFTPELFAKHQVSGICLDLAHLEEAKQASKRHYKRLSGMADKFTIGITHLSGVKTSVLYKIFNKTYVDHSLDSLNDLLYLKNYPPHYFAKIIVMEMENSFLEQAEIKKYLETIIK